MVCAVRADAQQLTIDQFDWPQWQGPERNNISREVGLLPRWPDKGPPLVWQIDDLGGGYSTPTIAGGLFFGMSYQGDEEVVWARAAATGKPVWSRVIAKANREVDYHEGSRGSCTIDDDRLYALGVSGDLVCLHATNGQPVWKANLIKDYEGILPHYRESYGYAESPLIDQAWVLVTPGGAKHTVVALDKLTGKRAWSAAVPEKRIKGYARADYSSLIRAQTNGVRHYIQFLHGGLVGVSDSGKLLWSWDKPSNDITNCSTPVFHRDRVFASSGYGKGGGLAQLKADANGLTVDEIWFNKHMKNHHGGMVLVGDHLYGASDPDMLVCLEFATGKLMWQQRNLGRGSIISADGRLYYRSENGPMHLVEANSAEYRERGSFEPPGRSKYRAWCHPVIAQGRMYLRDQNVLQCYDVRVIVGGA